MTIPPKGRRPMATMTEVAKLAGVAQTTVSFVLNGKATERGIPEKTVERVLQAADRLNYVPNSMARSLRSQRSRTVGVLFAHFRDDWADHLMQGIREEFESAGYVSLVAVHRLDGELERKEIQMLLERQVEAVLAIPNVAGRDNYSLLRGLGIPLVFLGDTLDEMPEANYVAWDAAEATRTAIEYLRDIGRRRVAFLGWDYPRPFIRVRYASYRETLSEAGLEFNEAWTAVVPTDDPAKLGLGGPDVAALERIFQDPHNRPDALFASGGSLSVNALATLRRLGLRVPEDVAMATVSAQRLIEHPVIGLPHIRVPSLEVGREAARVVLQLIEDPAQEPIQKVVACGRIHLPGDTMSREGSENSVNTATAMGATS